MSLAITIASLAITLVLFGKNLSSHIFGNKDSSDGGQIASTVILEETGAMSESKNPRFWLNSGGLAYIGGDIIDSIQGDLDKTSIWFKQYKKTNPIDTDNGLHPQNIFRLVTKDKYKSSSQEAYFKINKINLSKSSNRNESNGILFFINYQDSNNLYYAGIRVDGDAIIKKKIDGNYVTLAQSKVFDGNDYNKKTNYNLMPENRWIGIRSELKNFADRVEIKLYLDLEDNDNWKLVLDQIDSQNLIPAGHAGIRTDFMDFECKNYTINPI